MKIFTFYNHVPEHNALDELLLIQLWRERWTAAGFEPFVLNDWYARKHPFYEELHKAAAALPTVNPKDYELACFIRWLALAQVGGGFMSDYDCIPYPDEFGISGLSIPGGQLGGLHIYQERGCSPSLVHACPEVCLMLCKEFASGNVGSRPQGGLAHFSDQYAIEDLLMAKTDWIHTHDVVRCYGDEDWHQKQVVHYNNGSMIPKGLSPRWKHIPLLR